MSHTFDIPPPTGEKSITSIVKEPKSLSIEEFYHSCKKRWEKDTLIESGFRREHPLFQTMLMEGKKILPIVMGDLIKEPNWYALHLLCELFPHDNPIQLENRGQLGPMVQDWEAWYRYTNPKNKVNIEYREGDMFEHLTGDQVIVHACNGMGVWGAGFAKQLSNTFPNAYRMFYDYLEVEKTYYNVSGFTKWTSHEVNCDGMFDNNFTQWIGNIVTSKGFGTIKDKPHEIIFNTEMAITALLNDYWKDEITVFSPKFNSGLFEVPWAQTEQSLRQVLENTKKKVHWIVWTLKT